MASKNKTPFLPKNIQRIVMAVGLILLIPLLGNIFVDGWKWSTFDFIVAAIALFVTGLLIDAAIRKITNSTNRIIVILAILLTFFILWVEGATSGVSRTLISFF